MSRHRVLITDCPWGDTSVERDILDRADADVVLAESTDEDHLVDFAQHADAIGVCWAPVTERVICAASGLRIISRFGIGLDNIDICAASKRGIPVTNVPDYCVAEVADHALALLLACARNICAFDRQLKSGRYAIKTGPPLRRLSELTLGIVGFGRIGRALFDRARPLGMNIIAHSPSGNDHGTGCKMVSLSEIVASSHLVSIHAPLTDDTTHLFDRPAFEAMQDSAFLINTSRGAIVDQDALFHALESGAIAGAALDVFEQEPPDLSHPLFNHERLISTPHAAFVSDEALRELRTRTATQIADRLCGRRPADVVNHEALGQPT